MVWASTLGADADLLERLLEHSPVVIWPCDHEEIMATHCTCLDEHWERLPIGFADAYRARWRGSLEPLGELRAVWDDLDWLDFCQYFHPEN